MNNIILILMCGLPLSAFLMREVDIWHAHGMYFQFGVLCSFAYSLYRPRKPKEGNLALALLTLYIGILTSFWWYTGLLRNGYNITVFLPFFNFLCFVMFYNACVSLHEDDVVRVIKGLSYVVLLVLGYCILQQLQLDQFYRSIKMDENVDKLVGTVGNPSHLAGYLGMCLPVFYLKRTRLNVLGIYLTWIIIGLTGSTSGLLAAVAGTIFFLCFKRIYRAYDFVILGALAIFGVYYKYGGFNGAWLDYFNMHGRYAFWGEVWPLFKEKAITGWGLGRLGAMAPARMGTQFEGWRHTHAEYYQFAIELGLIGLGFITYGIIQYYKKFIKIEYNKTAIVLASIFTAFLANSILNFSAHVWLLASMGMFSYSAIYCLGGNNGYPHTQAN